MDNLCPRKYPCPVVFASHLKIQKSSVLDWHLIQRCCGAAALLGNSSISRTLNSLCASNSRSCVVKQGCDRAGGSGVGIMGVCAIYWGLCISSQEGLGSLPAAPPLCGHGLAGAHKGVNAVATVARRQTCFTVSWNSLWQIFSA